MSLALSRRTQTVLRISLALVLAQLAACTSTKPHRAPVEDRASAPAESPAVASPSTEPRAQPAPEAARPGTYIVKPGDTLVRIALDHGLSWRDLARWNSLDNPNLIETGQVLRVVAPTAVATNGSTGSDGLSSRPVASTPRAETKPLDAKPVDGKTAATQSAGTPLPSAAASAPVPAAPVTAPAALAEGELQWAWPSLGNLIAGFDEQRNKGLGISGKAGDAVLAAADGRVMYAGSGLRGYGNMVIIKHNETYLSAYAHNQMVLVKEDQVVRKGQRIAEMGSSDADQVKLHFEIRRKGKPIDPSKLLPPR
jgi:lipoprotein NlpD